MPIPWELIPAILGPLIEGGVSYFGHKSKKREQRRRERHPKREQKKFEQSLQKVKQKYKKYETLDKRQQKLQEHFSRLANKRFGGGIAKHPTYRGANQFLQQLYDPSSNAFEAFEAPIKRQFREEILPEIATRFSGLNARSSSGFNQTIARAGTDLSERLAALRSGVQLQGLTSALPFAAAPSEQATGLLSTAFHPSFGLHEKYAGIGLPPPQQPSAWAQGLAPLTGGISGGIGEALGRRFAQGFGGFAGGASSGGYSGPIRAPFGSMNQL